MKEFILGRFVLLGALALTLTPVAAPSQNTQVNNPDNSAANLDNSTTQSETNHAVYGSTIVVGYNSSTQYASLGTSLNSITGFAFSTNGGTSFTDAGLLAPPTGY